MMGSDIFYKHISGMQYEMTFKIYRDCNGIALLNLGPNAKVECVGGSSAPLNLTLQSITNVTPVCIGAPLPCNPQNTAQTGNGVEEHVYTAIVDFGVAPYNSLVSCGNDIVFSIGRCCRNSAITTGVAGSFYSEAVMKFNPGSIVNNSPAFDATPIFRSSLNQTSTFALGAVDTLDHDSISFSFDNPQSNRGISTPYNATNISSNHPFDAFYPAGTSAPFSDPDTIPAVGIFLDAKSGNLVATSTSSNQVTVMTILVKEWRKDRFGVYQNISEVRREAQFFVSNTQSNEVPRINFESVGSRTKGNDCVEFQVVDNVVIPPPPTPIPNPDTLKLKLLGSNSHLQLTIDSSKYLASGTTVYGKVCYDSLWSVNGDNTIYLSAQDNACPMNAIVSKGITIDFPDRVFQSTAGVGPIPKLSGVKMYPNPASERLNLTRDQPLKNGKIEIVNLTG